TLDGDGTFQTDPSTTLTLSNVIDGPGALTKQGAGTLVLHVANAYSGGTTIAAGILQIDVVNALGDAAGPLTFEGGTLQFGSSFELAATREITLNLSGGTFDTNGFSDTIVQSIIGGGSLTKAGAGTLLLAGDNDYSGDTIIAGGTLQLGNGGV